MFQSGALFGSMTVGENLALPLTEWTDLPPDAVSAIVRAKLRLQAIARLHDERIVRWEETVTVDLPVVAARSGDTADAAVEAIGRALRMTVDRIADRVVRELAVVPAIGPAVPPAASVSR